MRLPTTVIALDVIRPLSRAEENDPRRGESFRSWVLCFLFLLGGVAGCSKQESADLIKAKAEAEIAKAELARVKAEASAAISEKKAAEAEALAGMLEARIEAEAKAKAEAEALQKEFRDLERLGEQANIDYQQSLLGKGDMAEAMRKLAEHKTRQDELLERLAKAKEEKLKNVISDEDLAAAAEVAFGERYGSDSPHLDVYREGFRLALLGGGRPELDEKPTPPDRAEFDASGKILGGIPQPWYDMRSTKSHWEQEMDSYREELDEYDMGAKFASGWDDGMKFAANRFLQTGSKEDQK